MRPVDVPVIEADIRKLQACTGWRTEIPLEKTMEDTLNYWRTTLAREAQNHSGYGDQERE